MDGRHPSAFLQHSANTLDSSWPASEEIVRSDVGKQPVVCRHKQKSLVRQSIPHKKRVRMGREVVKSGMAASMAVTLLTGLKVLRPMSMHPVAGWVFLGLSIVHMVMYEKPSRSGRRTKPH